MVTESELVAQLGQQASAIIVSIGALILAILGSLALWARTNLPKLLDQRLEGAKKRDENDTLARRVAIQREQINNDVLLRLSNDAKAQTEALTVLTKELGEAQGQIDGLKAGANYFTQQIETLKQQLQAANALTETLRNEIKTLTERLATSERENADLQRQLGERQKELEAQRKQIADLQRQITAVEHRSENGNGNTQQAEGEKPSG